MSLLNYLRPKNKSSAQMAKERLKVIVAHERTHRNGPDYLPMLEQDILAAIRKYVHVDEDAVNVHIERDGEMDMLELNITLPEHK